MIPAPASSPWRSSCRILPGWASRHSSTSSAWKAASTSRVVRVRSGLTIRVWWQVSSESRPNGATNQGIPAATRLPCRVGVSSALRSRRPRDSSEL